MYFPTCGTKKLSKALCFISNHLRMFFSLPLPFNYYICAIVCLFGIFSSSFSNSSNTLISITCKVVERYTAFCTRKIIVACLSAMNKVNWLSAFNNNTKNGDTTSSLTHSRTSRTQNIKDETDESLCVFWWHTVGNTIRTSHVDAHDDDGDDDDDDNDNSTNGDNDDDNDDGDSKMCTQTLIPVPSLYMGMYNNTV